METVFDLGKLGDASYRAKEASKKLDDYYGSLNRKVKSLMDSYQAVAHRSDWNDNMQTAYAMIQSKMGAIRDAKDNYTQYKIEIDNLKEKAEGVESRIISQMNDTLSVFCRKHNLDFTPSDENPPSNIFAGFIDWLGRKISGWANYIWKTTKDVIRQWYNYYGGAEIIGVIFAVAMVVVAIIALAVAWPAVAAATGVWATIVAVAGVISASIALLNSVVQLAYAVAAASSGVQGKLFDSAWYSFNSENGSFTAQLREWGFYDVANVIDLVDTVCSAITFVANVAEMFKNIGKIVKAPKTDKLKNIRQNYKSIMGEGSKEALKNVFFKSDAKATDYFTKGTKYVKAAYDFVTYNDPTGKDKKAGGERFKKLNPFWEALAETAVDGILMPSLTETTTTQTTTETGTKKDENGNTITATRETEKKVTVDERTGKTVGENTKTTDTVSTQYSNGDRETTTITRERGWQQDAYEARDNSNTMKRSYKDEYIDSDGNKLTVEGSKEYSKSSSGNGERFATDKISESQESSMTAKNKWGWTTDKATHETSSSETVVTKKNHDGQSTYEKKVVEKSSSAKNFDGSKFDSSSKETSKTKINSDGSRTEKSPAKSRTTGTENVDSKADLRFKDSYTRPEKDDGMQWKSKTTSKTTVDKTVSIKPISGGTIVGGLEAVYEACRDNKEFGEGVKDVLQETTLGSLVKDATEWSEHRYAKPVKPDTTIPSGS